MSTIYIFRHGQTDFNQKKVFTGWLQSNLTDLGRQQAEGVAQLLKAKRIDVAYVSSLKRCQETLNIILTHHPECQHTIIDDRILERSYGDLAGRSHQEIIDEFGQEQFDRWHRGWSDRPPAGESYADVQVRVQAFIDDLKQLYGGGALNIAISGSSNSIRLFRKIMENVSESDACSWTIPYDTYFEYEI